MRLEQITFTRFLAAIGIVLFHFGTQTAPFNFQPTAFLFTEGNIGVSYFFILSGFIMVISYSGKGTIPLVDYYRKRVARIYPLYLLAILLFFAYFIFVHGIIDYTAMGLNILLLQSWSPKYALSFNGPGWSLAVETLFYLLFPLLFNTIYSKATLKRLVLPILAIWAVTQAVFVAGLYAPFYQHAAIKTMLSYFPLMHVSQFLMGNLAGLFFVKYQQELRGSYDVALLLLLAALILLLKYPPGKYPAGLLYHDGLMALIFVPLILLLSANTGIITRVFRARPLIFLGEISYGVYILQRPVFVWSREMLAGLGITNATTKFYLFLTLLLVVAVVCYYLVEVPLRKMIIGFRIRKKDKLQYA